LVLLDSRGDSGGGASRGGSSEDFDEAGGGAASRPQARPQAAAFDTDLDDDVTF